MTRKVERDQKLEQQRPLGVRRAEKREQTRRRASIGDHVEHGAEFARLAERARGLPVDGVEQARDGVEDHACFGVVGHEEEGARGEDDASVPDEVGHEEEDVFVLAVGRGMRSGRDI